MENYRRKDGTNAKKEEKKDQIKKSPHSGPALGIGRGCEGLGPMP